MYIKNKKAPSLEMVKQYEKLLNFYLSDHQVNVKILIHEIPTDIICIQGENSWIERLWISAVIVNSPEFNNFPVRLINSNIRGGKGVEKRAWNDAHHIQDLLYQKSKRTPSHPPKEDDAYWNLWKKCP